MKLDEAAKQIDAVLAAKSSRLVNEIKRMLVERPFLLDDGIAKDYVNGIHFEYEWDSFVPIACPLNTKSGYCGAGKSLAVLDAGEKALLPGAIEEHLLSGVPESERESLRDAWSELQTQKYVEWFTDCWKKARGASPHVRGFLSVHDTIWRTDLDSGEEFREDDGKVTFFKDAA